MRRAAFGFLCVALLVVLVACAAPAAAPATGGQAAPTLVPGAAGVQREGATPVAPPAATAQPAAAPTSASSAGLDQLIAKAKQEGQITVYSAAGAVPLDKLVKGFETKYGLKAEVVNLASTPLTQRFESDLKAGNPQADIFQYTDELHAQDLVKRGEVAKLTTDEVPALSQWSASFWNGYYAKFSVVPHVIIYNTKVVPEGQAPKDWNDIVDPKWKGKMLLIDPRATTSYLGQYYLWQEKYGDDFIKKLAANEPRIIDNANSGVQSLAAGDVSLLIFGYPYNTLDLKSKGAPVAEVVPSFMAGAERLIMVPSKARHPAAARLFMQWALGNDGQAAFNGGFQGASPLANIPDTLKLPAGYVTPDWAKVKADLNKIKELMNIS